MNPEDIEDGRLNVACLVVTKPSDDGRYLNIARVVSRKLVWLFFLGVWTALRHKPPTASQSTSVISAQPRLPPVDQN